MEKEKLEVLQRKDRKLRNAHRKANPELYKGVPPSI